MVPTDPVNLKRINPKPTNGALGALARKTDLSGDAVSGTPEKLANRTAGEAKPYVIVSLFKQYAQPNNLWAGLVGAWGQRQALIKAETKNGYGTFQKAMWALAIGFLSLILFAPFASKLPPILSPFLALVPVGALLAFCFFGVQALMAARQEGSESTDFTLAAMTPVGKGPANSPPTLARKAIETGLSHARACGLLAASDVDFRDGFSGQFSGVPFVIATRAEGTFGILRLPKSVKVQPFADFLLSPSLWPWPADVPPELALQQTQVPLALVQRGFDGKIWADHRGSQAANVMVALLAPTISLILAANSQVQLAVIGRTVVFHWREQDAGGACLILDHAAKALASLGPN